MSRYFDAMSSMTAESFPQDKAKETFRESPRKASKLLKRILPIPSPLAAGSGLCSSRETGYVFGRTGHKTASSRRGGRGSTETALWSASVSGGGWHSLPRCKKFVS